MVLTEKSRRNILNISIETLRWIMKPQSHYHDLSNNERNDQSPPPADREMRSKLKDLNRKNKIIYDQDTV
jgi:hypothetical protein